MNNDVFTVPVYMDTTIQQLLSKVANVNITAVLLSQLENSVYLDNPTLSPSPIAGSDKKDISMSTVEVSQFTLSELKGYMKEKMLRYATLYEFICFVISEKGKTNRGTIFCLDGSANGRTFPCLYYVQSSRFLDLLNFHLLSGEKKVLVVHQ